MSDIEQIDTCSKKVRGKKKERITEVDRLLCGIFSEIFSNEEDWLRMLAKWREEEEKTESVR